MTHGAPGGLSSDMVLLICLCLIVTVAETVFLRQYIRARHPKQYRTDRKTAASTWAAEMKAVEHRTGLPEKILIPSYIKVIPKLPPRAPDTFAGDSVNLGDGVIWAEGACHLISLEKTASSERELNLSVLIAYQPAILTIGSRQFLLYTFSDPRH